MVAVLVAMVPGCGGPMDEETPVEEGQTEPASSEELGESQQSLTLSHSCPTGQYVTARCVGGGAGRFECRRRSDGALMSSQGWVCYFCADLGTTLSCLAAWR